MDKIILEPIEHKYTLNGQPILGVTNTIERAGLRDLSSINPGVLEAAQKFGTAVHSACELHDKNDLAIDVLAEPLKPYLNGWIKFLKDSKFRVHRVEFLVYSKRWRYAGMLDRTGLFAASNTIIDLKSGAEDPTVKVQTAAYQEAYNEMFPKNKIRRRLTVMLKPDNYKIIESSDKSDFSTFLACLQITNFKNKHKIK